MVKLQNSFLGNVPLVPLCAGKRNTRKPLRRRHFLRLFLLFLFKEEKQQKKRAGGTGFACPPPPSASGLGKRNKRNKWHDIDIIYLFLFHRPAQSGTVVGQHALPSCGDGAR